jgi:hypothetical protein
MNIKRFAASGATLLFCIIALTAAARAADSHSATWKMNPAKSTYSPVPAAKSITATVEVDETGVKVNSEGTDGEGKPTHVEYTAKFDGQDYPITGAPNADTISVRRDGDNTLVSTVKKGGQVVMTVTSTVSKDGKTRTSTFKGKDAQGRDVNNVVVYDKQ